MEWIRDNIEHFGGDLNRISMFGQSAGAGLVDLYSFAYVDDPIATGFGLFSGVADGGAPPAQASVSAQAWRNLGGKLGCNNATANAELRACMMQIDAQDLSAALATNASFGTDTGPGFGPTQDDDVLYGQYDNRVSAPGGYLIGNTDYEAGMFLPYRPDYNDLVWRSLNNALFTCPAAKRAKQASSDGRSAWRFRYFGDFPNMVVSTSPASKAWHGSEVSSLLLLLPFLPSYPSPRIC